MPGAADGTAAFMEQCLYAWPWYSLMLYLVPARLSAQALVSHEASKKYGIYGGVVVSSAILQHCA
jgi:hypothetical protein